MAHEIEKGVPLPPPRDKEFISPFPDIDTMAMGEELFLRKRLYATHRAAVSYGESLGMTFSLRETDEEYILTRIG